MGWCCARPECMTFEHMEWPFLIYTRVSSAVGNQMTRGHRIAPDMQKETPTCLYTMQMATCRYAFGCHKGPKQAQPQAAPRAQDARTPKTRDQKPSLPGRPKTQPPTNQQNKQTIKITTEQTNKQTNKQGYDFASSYPHFQVGVWG